MNNSRTFVVASEDNLIDLIKRARQRLVVVCPALTTPVAEALASRLPDEGMIGITVVLDADPEVYRLGYGTQAALERLHKAAAHNLFDLRMQSGVRIGVVISDDVTMVFSPVPLLIEAGSTSTEKPNAIVLSNGASDRLAEATGAGPAEERASQEIGAQPLRKAAVDAVDQDLKVNPPQQFDVARAMRVFSSRVQYVEFEVENYRLSSRQIELPADLLNITDELLKRQISGRVRPPAEALGAFEIEIETADGKQEKVKANEKWLSGERKRIEDAYTFVVPRFGRIILTKDRKSFDEEIEKFKRNLNKYYEAVVAKVEGVKENYENRLVVEYLPKWKQNPPSNFKRYGVDPTPENLKRQLRLIVEEVIRKAVSFEAPQVRVVYKNVAPESVRDPKFLQPLRKIMQHRGVPVCVIDSLFASGDAAPARGALAATS
jgi:hypothetical protein